MASKRRQERIATSRLTLPITVIYGIVITLAAGTIQQGLWVQAASLFIATEMIAILNNRYSLIRVYSRMLSCTYLLLSAMVCFRTSSTDGTIVTLCTIAFYLFLFQVYLLCLYNDWHCEYLLCKDSLFRSLPLDSTHRLHFSL